jgi:hypothetical protein
LFAHADSNQLLVLFIELWSKAERAAGAEAEAVLFDKYMNGKDGNPKSEYARHMDVLHAFMSDCEARNVDYVDAFLQGNMTAEQYEKVCTKRACKSHS